MFYTGTKFDIELIWHEFVFQVIQQRVNVCKFRMVLVKTTSN